MSQGYSVGSYLSDDQMTFDGVPSAAHPDGHAYTVPAPCAADELIIRRIVHLEDELSKLTGVDDIAPRKGETVTQTTIRLEALIAATTPLRDEHKALVAKLDTDDKGQPVEHAQKMLGTAYAVMLADGVRPRHMDELASLVTTNYGSGERVARAVVAAAAGEALARSNRATRRAAAKKPNGSRAKAGLKSAPASGAVSTRNGPASTRGSATSAAKKAAARKTA